jgi:uncharacterized integral membrane protein
MILIQRLIFLAVILALAIVAFQNQGELGRSVDFVFLRWRLSLILGFWLLFSFLGGGMLFLLFDAWRSLRLRMEIRRRDQIIARMEQEAAFRSPPPPPTPGPAE